jgi:hypothetical protein
MSMGALVTLIILSIAVSPAHARMGMGSGSGGGNSEVISGQINDLTEKYNGNHTGLMQAFSGKFGDKFYIIVKSGFRSMSKYEYEAQIDSRGDVTITEIRSGMGMRGMMRRGIRVGYDCDSNICITTTKGDLNTAYNNLMANSNDYLTLEDVTALSIKLWKTWFLNEGLFDDILDWIQEEYLGYVSDPEGS